MSKHKYIKNFGKNEFNEFLELLNSFQDCKLASSKIGRDDGHYDTYKYQSSKGKFDLHFDTKGNVLQLIADEEILINLIDLADSVKKITVQKPDNIANKKTATIIKAGKPAKKPLSKPESVIINIPEKPESNLKKTKTDKAKKQSVNINGGDEKIPRGNIINNNIPEHKNPENDRKDGFVLKHYTLERLERALELLKKENGITIGKADEFNQGAPNSLIQHSVKDTGKNKITIQFMLKSKTVQIQGKRSDLFTKVQIFITGESDDINSTVKAYIDYSKKEEAKDSEVSSIVNNNRSDQIQKQPVPLKHDKTTKALLNTLKSKLPDAFSYLTEAEKAQLTFTLIDLDSNVRNYSGVLLPSYITLEQIISNLQKKENINVKMIGQAYEKITERHSLKKAYSKKIKSVVFVEVLDALYNEYNKRHKYVHSDSGGMMNIMDKETAKTVFDEILEIINYNYRKLKEINFIASEVPDAGGSGARGGIRH